MRRVLLFLVVAAIVVALAWQVAKLPGEAVVQISGVTVEASAPVMVLGAALLFAVLYLLIRLLVGLVTLPRKLRRWRAERNRRLGDAAVTRALVALAAGEQGDARREAARSRRLLGDTAQTLLLTAQAGRLAGRDNETEQAFRALAETKDAAFLGLRGLLRMAIARQDWEEAEAIAHRAEEAHPGAAWLREERARLAVRAGAWKEALTLGGPQIPRAAYGTAAAAAEPDPAAALRLAREAWKADPAFAPAALVYATKLRENGRERRAQAVLRTTWEAAPQPDIGAAFLAPVTDPTARVAAAERLCAVNPDHLESHLLKAGCALAAGMLAEARRHAEAAQHMANQRRVWVLLADIAEREQPDGETSRAAFRQAGLADPDPAWRCDACGTAQVKWLPTCPACQQSGRIDWRITPPHPVVAEEKEGQAVVAAEEPAAPPQ